MTDQDPFYEAIAPVRDSLQRLIDSVSPESGVPSAESRAMEEISLQSQFEGEWGAEPVEHAHFIGTWKRTLAVDCAKAMIRDLREDPAPVFAFKVLSRAVLENAASAAWLLDPRIAVRLRIARGRNERIYSAKQLLRLNWLPVEKRQHSEEIVETIRVVGKRLGFSVSANGWLEEDRPSFTGLLRWMLGDDLGSTIANYYSAVAHGTQYGLASAVIDFDVPTGPIGTRRVAIGLSSSDVNFAVAVAGMALIKAFESERELMGRDWPEWESSRDAALSIYRSAFQAPASDDR
jgi:hypothetical protein